MASNGENVSRSWNHQNNGVPRKSFWDFVTCSEAHQSGILPSTYYRNHRYLTTQMVITSCVWIMLGPHEAGVWAKHPSLTIPAPSRGEPSRHLGSSYQHGVSILSPFVADLSGLWGSSMQVMHGRPQGLFSRWQGGSGILKIIKS